MKHTVDPIFQVTDSWVLILGSLPPKEVVQFALVNTRCTTLARNESVWQALFKATYPATFEMESQISKDKAFMKDWYSAFQQRLYLEKHWESVVLDFGTTFAKWSFNGHFDCLASAISYACFGHNSVPSKGADNEFEIGFGFIRPFERGQVQNYYLAGYIKNIYRRRCRLNLQAHPLLISIPFFGWEPGVEDAFIQVMKYLDIRYYCMVPQAVLSLTAVGKKSGIVLHLGAFASGLVRVVEGKVKRQYRLPEDWRTSDRQSTAQIVAGAVKAFIENPHQSFCKKELWNNIVLDGGNAADLETHLVTELKQNPSFTGFLKTTLPENDCLSLYPIYGGHIFSHLSHYKNRCLDLHNDPRPLNILNFASTNPY